MVLELDKPSFHCRAFTLVSSVTAEASLKSIWMTISGKILADDWLVGVRRVPHCCSNGSWAEGDHVGEKKRGILLVVYVNYY